MKQSPRAFTLIEILIVMMILGILAIGISINFEQSKKKAYFNDAELVVTNLIQRARGLSLTNLLVNGTDIALYYELSAGADYIQLEAVSDSNSELLEYIEFEHDIEIDKNFIVYYYPPDGEVAISTGDSTIQFTLESPDGYYTIYRIDNIGGYPEIEERGTP